MNGEEKLVRRYALVSATLASFLTPFAASSLNIAIPDIGKHFNSSAITLPWIQTSYLLASAVLLVPFGRMADIYGRKKAGFLLSLYLQIARGLSPQMAGLILLFQPLTQALLSPAAGRLSDKVEPRIVASLGMGLTTFARLTNA